MIFENPKGNKIKLDELLYQIIEIISTHPQETFRIIIGTDSQKKSNGINFISVIVLYRVGKGGTYFLYRERVNDEIDIKKKIYKETFMTLEIAQKVKEILKDKINSKILELHVDIGEQGQTREFIKDLLRIIEEKGFQPSIKPQSFAASKVADRHTK